MTCAVPIREQGGELAMACLDLLRERGAYVWRQGLRIIGLLPNGGRFLLVKCAAAGSRPDEEQQAFLDAVKRRGGLAVVVYDAADLADIIDREMKSEAS
jgi:hypothetical protein